MWLLDTDICISLIKKKPEHLLHRLHEVDIAAVSVSAVTVAELQSGVANTARPEQNALALAAFPAPLGVEAFEDAAAAAYGPLRAELERVGTLIGSLDLVVAARALASGRIVVTNKTREFRRVAGLKVEDWIEE